MSFQVHFRSKNHELFLHTLLVGALEVIFSEVNLKCIVVLEILLLSRTVLPITDVTSFMLVAAMRVQFVIAIESLLAEAALGMTLEPALIDSPRVVVAV